MSQLNLSRPPRLPSAPQEYTQLFADQSNDILRLYFNQLDNAVNALIGRRGGQYINTPHGAFSRSTDLLLPAANTAYIVGLTTTDMASGMYFTPGDGVHVEQSGVYNYQFSVQFANTDSQAHTAYIWLRVNGVDAPSTASKFDIPAKHGTSDGYLIAACNFFVSLSAGDYVEMWCAADAVEGALTDGVYIEAYTAQTSPFARPAIPSVVVTLSFVSSPST